MRTVITKTLGLVLMTAILTLSLTGCTDRDGVSETDAIETSSVGVITTPDEITSDIPKKQAFKTVYFDMGTVQYYNNVLYYCDEGNLCKVGKGENVTTDVLGKSV